MKLKPFFIGPNGLRAGWRLLIFLVILVHREVPGNRKSRRRWRGRKAWRPPFRSSRGFTRRIESRLEARQELAREYLRASKSAAGGNSTCVVCSELSGPSKKTIFGGDATSTIFRIIAVYLSGVRRAWADGNYASGWNGAGLLLPLPASGLSMSRFTTIGSWPLRTTTASHGWSASALISWCGT